MFSFFHKLIRIFLILFLIFVLGWLTWKKLVPSGSMEVIYDMKKETPFISKLYPKDRVSEAKNEGNDNYYRVILAEPVYFNLEPNGEFKEAEISVKYRFAGEGSLKIGGLINKPNWAFDFVEMPETGKNEWGAVKANFDLSELAKDGENFRFMFSAPELISEQLKIDEIKVILKREPITFKEAINKILDAVLWRIKRIL